MDADFEITTDWLEAHVDRSQDREEPQNRTLLQKDWRNQLHEWLQNIDMVDLCWFMLIWFQLIT